MVTLHIVRTSGFSKQDFQACLNTMASKDIILLTDDGCYNVSHPELKKLLPSHNTLIYMLEQHAKARGIETAESINLIDEEAVLALIFKCNNSVTWQ